MNVISTLVFLLLFQGAFSQYNWSELTQKLEASQGQLGNNVVCMVWNHDSVVYKKEMGAFSTTTQAPIASCSKWLTAALVMQFVDEGKLSLDDKVSKYIPIFDSYFKSYITIRQCLCHETGIKDDEKFLARILDSRKYATLEDEVNAFAKRGIRANPGTDFWYGNIGLNIAGRVLEIISKKKFDVLIKEKLFKPLGMTRSSFSAANGAINPSGGAVSSADDYMKFMVMMLNKGKYNGQQVLSESSVNEMTKVQDTKEMIRYTPKAAEGFLYASGSWVAEEKNITSPEGEGRQGAALACPGLFGTWPLVDFCRGYAFIIFVKNFLGEQRAETDKEIKSIIDKQIKTPDCK